MHIREMLDLPTFLVCHLSRCQLESSMTHLKGNDYVQNRDCPDHTFLFAIHGRDSFLN